MKVTEEQYFLIGNQAKVEATLATFSDYYRFALTEKENSALADAYNLMIEVKDSLNEKFEVVDDKPT